MTMTYKKCQKELTVLRYSYREHVLKVEIPQKISSFFNNFYFVADKNIEINNGLSFCSIVKNFQ